tara:strand:- start:126 stop:239 length:114 start_codon:yes stop_codon:yes gene_type:complete
MEICMEEWEEERRVLDLRLGLGLGFGEYGMDTPSPNP